MSTHPDRVTAQGVGEAAPIAWGPPAWWVRQHVTTMAAKSYRRPVPIDCTHDAVAVRGVCLACYQRWYVSQRNRMPHHPAGQD